MTQENQISPESHNSIPQFNFHIHQDYFELDAHQELSGRRIARIELLAGRMAADDLYLLVYDGIPNLSIYDSRGQLVDIDHYLPDDYNDVDAGSVENMLANFSGLKHDQLNDQAQYAAIIDNIYSRGGDDFFKGLDLLFGIECSTALAEAYTSYAFDEDKLGDVVGLIKKNFVDLKEFLQSLLTFLQKSGSGYIHITAKGNIIITPLLRRSGMSLVIETRNASGDLLKPNKWNIIRTNNTAQLEQALVFRSPDVKAYFEENPTTEYNRTLRYVLFRKQEELVFDSLMDNTDNVLRVSLYNDCFQILAADEDVVMILNKTNSITIVNAHRSVVPQKWAQEIELPFPVNWARVDQNISAVFVQDEAGEISVLSIDGNEATLMASIGTFSAGFEIDQAGNLLVENKAGVFIMINTSINEYEHPNEKRSVNDVLKNLAHLFKSDQLFSEKQFARVINQVEADKKETLPPPIIDKLKFDFDTNVEHMLAKAGNSYEKLQDVQQLVGLARQNLSDELTFHAEKEGVRLVGYKLKRILNAILSPIEMRVNELVELSRSKLLLDQTEDFVLDIKNIQDPGQYREILNTVRSFKDELESMNQDVIADHYADFLAFHKQLSNAFANQVAKDDSSLAAFIREEIEQIERAINKCRSAKKLEVLLSTHPAALELMDMLKQPFVLQTIAKDNSFSPALIQRRLFKNVEKRQAALQAAKARKEAEKLAAKEQLASMSVKAIDFFVKQHSGSFSLIELRDSAAYNRLQNDFYQIEEQFGDTRLANDLRRRLERKILERSRKDLEKIVAFEGKYAFIQNDADLFVDDEANIQEFPSWHVEFIDKKGSPDLYLITFVRSSDHAVYRPSVQENLTAHKSFEIHGDQFVEFWEAFDNYRNEDNNKEYLTALWNIHIDKNQLEDFPHLNKSDVETALPKTEPQKKGLRCALEIKLRKEQEKDRERDVPKISPEFIDDTPYFKQKLNEFIIKAKLQLMSGTGIILLTGPPSTGKSTFLKFAAWLMNREYFEHAADKWQTKNSLITAIKFSEFGPYATPAAFTRAITTPNSLINIEEIKEWPEALRKALNPFFGGGKMFVAPDGTEYGIGQNILMCAAANLGSMYRQDNEPFTADFWSRIEVVEYNYAPGIVQSDYVQGLFVKQAKPYLTLSEMIQDYFHQASRPKNIQKRAAAYAKQFVEFVVLPKADELIKRKNIQNYINEYFKKTEKAGAGEKFNPEEAAKIALKRVKSFRQFSLIEFYDLYDHVINKSKLRSADLRKLAKSDVERFNQIKIRILIIRNVEGILRYLRSKFYATAGQTEVEGTNREFIKIALLLDIVGEL